MRVSKPKILIIPISMVFISLIRHLYVNDNINFHISVLSALFVYSSIQFIANDRKIKSYSIFLLTYFSGLYLSTLKLSIYQTEKSIIDMYFYFIGPVFFSIILFIFESVRIKFIRFYKIISIDYFYIFLISLYVVTKIYISTKVGWRIESLFISTFLISGDEYSIPGFSGFAITIQWLLLIFAPYTKKKYVVISATLITFFSIMHVKRGDILRMVVFFIIWYISSIYNKQLLYKTKHFLLKLSLSLFVIFSIFTFLGNIRELARNSTDDVMARNIGIENAPYYLSWFYGYIPINYEILRYYYIDNPKESTCEYSALKNLFISDQKQYYEYSLNGFNASTFLTTFIKDFGDLYFYEMIIFGLYIGCIILLIKAEKFKGLYMYILSIFSLSYFGNYFETRSINFAIIISLIIFPFILKDKK